ncbi:hypothetical protein [Parerythrobacter lacustris]|uniref:Tripartite tricarboxylate transporter TctB family protein n=1 Tax=Parerythrobacter lacustris TaxID=2969984 RepID=A0ABT1XSD2_9SPHN|nr:hypothetical protein [Parerythrobacter lacustris]MCR2834568.1 hypothetical protein [Parerythrobacter lacustris]
MTDGHVSWRIRKGLAIFAAIAGFAAMIWFYVDAGPDYWEIPDDGRRRHLKPFFPVIVYGFYLFIVYSWTVDKMPLDSDD